MSKRTLQNNHKTGLGCALLMVPIVGFTCDMHGVGGFGNFPMIHARPPALDVAKIAAPISVKHATKVMVSSGRDATLAVSYQIPEGYENVEISFSGPEELRFQEEPVFYPKQQAGMLHLKYNATDRGRYSMTLHIKARQNRRLVSKYQNIDIYAG